MLTAVTVIYTLLKGPHFWMAKKLANFGICGKIFDEISTD